MKSHLLKKLTFDSEYNSQQKKTNVKALRAYLPTETCQGINFKLKITYKLYMLPLQSETKS
jgi:hypothetical protein